MFAWWLTKKGHARTPKYWVAVKELNFSYYIGETITVTVYAHYGNLI